MTKRRQHTIGSGEVEPEFVETMAQIARAIDFAFNGPNGPKRIGYVLMVFPFGDKPGRCNYMSNGNREDVITLFKEQLSYFEGQSDKHGPGHA